MGLFCLRFIHRYHLFFHLLLLYSMTMNLLEDLPWGIVSEITWQFVRTRSWVLVIVSYGSTSSDGEFSCQAIFHPWNSVPTTRRDVDRVGIVRARPRHFAGEDLRPTSWFAEVSRATVFVFGEVIKSFLVDCKGYRIGPRSRYIHFFLVFLLGFLCKGVGWFWKGWVHVICSWSWILIYSDVCQRACRFHLFSSFSETASHSFRRRESTWDFISIGRRILWGTNLDNVYLWVKSYFCPNPREVVLQLETVEGRS